MRDQPGYGRQKAGGGPRTKRQRRLLRDRKLLLKQQELMLERQEAELELLRREPTLHSINWQPSSRK